MNNTNLRARVSEIGRVDPNESYREGSKLRAHYAQVVAVLHPYRQGYIPNWDKGRLFPIEEFLTNAIDKFPHPYTRR